MKFRPAAAVAADLLRLATPKARRPRRVREPVLNVRPAPLAEEDETPDEPAAPKITLPPVTLSGGITDEDVGMKRDDIAQAQAERWLSAAYAYQMKQAEKVRDSARRRMVPGYTVHVDVPDEALGLVRPTDALNTDDLAIRAELERLAARPRCRWHA